MRLKIHHETVYRYAVPALSVIQQLRLTPRSHEGQFVRKWRVEIDADCRLERGEDAYGNIIHTFTAEGPLSELKVTVDGDVETTDTHGLVRDALERFPRAFWLRETELTRAGPEIAEFISDLAAGEGGDRLATLHALNAAIFQSMSFSLGATHTGTTARDAFACRNGVCQDFAHVFIAACRSIGIPARYACGYFLRTDTHAQDAGHAWVEAYADDVGWIGFDPAHGLSVTGRYVRVASGLDYLDTAPIRGARIGGAGETMSVEVQVHPGPVILDT